MVFIFLSLDYRATELLPINTVFSSSANFRENFIFLYGWMESKFCRFTASSLSSYQMDQYPSGLYFLAAINTDVQESLRWEVEPFGQTPGMLDLRHRAALCLHFWACVTLVFIVDLPDYSHLQRLGSSFSTSSPASLGSVVLIISI